MVRNYKKTTTRGYYRTAALKEALYKVREGQPVAKVSRDYGIPRRTLVRHRNASVSNPGVVQLGRFNTVLSVNTEEALVYHIQDMERRLYGITTIDIRHLAYETAEKLNMNNCVSKSTKMAGVDWLQGFLSRHPNLSIRVPTATNLSRAVAFNSVKVIQFFDVYKEILQDGTYDNASIWNMDESGISNVQKPGKIIATRGSRTV